MFKFIKILIYINIFYNHIFGEDISSPFLNLGHTGLISSIAIDENTIVSGSFDKTIKLWDLESGKLLKTLKGHNRRIKSVAIDDDVIVSGSIDKTIRIWNRRNGKLCKVLKGHTKSVYSLIIHNGTIISGSSDNKIKIWDLKNGKLLKTLEGHTDTVSSLAVYNDVLVSGSHDGTLKLWNLKTGKYINTLYGHNKPVCSVSIDKDVIVSGSKDGTVIIWNRKNCYILKKLQYSNESIHSIKTNKKYIFIGFSDKVVVYGKSVGDALKAIVLFSSSMEVKENILIIGGDRTISIININKIKDLKMLKNLSQTVSSVNVDRNIMISGSGKSIKTWDIENGILLRKLKVYSHVSSISIDENTIVSGSDDGIIRIWDKKNGKLLKTLNRNKSLIVNNPIKSIALDGNAIVSIEHMGKSIKIWDKRSGELLKTLTSDNLISSIAVFGNVIASGHSYGKVLIWEKDNDTYLKTINTNSSFIEEVKSIAIDDNTIVFGGSFDNFNSAIKIWSRKTEKFLDSCDSRGYVYSIVIQGDIIVSGNSNCTVDIFSKDGGKLLKTLKGHGGFVNSVSICGDIVVSGSDDGTIKRWSLKTGKVLATFLDTIDGWLIITPEGYFTGSKGAAQYLNITKYTKYGMEPFDFSQLYDHFFRPDLVKLKLSGDEEAYQKAIAGMSYEEALKNPPPKLTFERVDDNQVEYQRFNYDPVGTKKKNVKLTFSVKEHDGGGIGLIRIYQEGKLIKTIGKGRVNKQAANVDAILEQEKLDSKARQKQKQYLSALSKAVSRELNLSVEETIAEATPDTTTNKEGNYTIELELKPGSNEIAIEAFNKTNTVTSYRESITINADIPKQKPKLYAIVAGVNEFEVANVNNLKYSENDAKAIKEAIEKYAKGLYKDVEVYYLSGKNLTKANLLKAAKNIRQKAKLIDTVLFYISTHGRAAKGKLFLVPYNNRLIKDWIDFEQLFQTIQFIKSLNQIFIVDACESGKANDIVSSVYDSRASVLAKSSGVHVLLATTRGTSAFESSNPNVKNSVFTAKILKALKDKTTDENKDNTITVIELSKKLKALQSTTDYQYPVIRNVGKDIGLEKIRD